MCGMALCTLNVRKPEAYPRLMRYNTKMMLCEY